MQYLLWWMENGRGYQQLVPSYYTGMDLGHEKFRGKSCVPWIELIQGEQVTFFRKISNQEMVGVLVPIHEEDEPAEFIPWCGQGSHFKRSEQESECSRCGDIARPNQVWCDSCDAEAERMDDPLVDEDWLDQSVPGQV